ncbi:MAG: M61 family metallopeptidase [Flammeovirgaceae bacterium]
MTRSLSTDISSSMHYTVSYDNPASQFVDFKLQIANISTKKLHLQLPAWRPGRYTLQNFAKNIHRFEVHTKEGKPIAFKKITKDCWEVQTKNIKAIEVHYSYYAAQMDAGGSWLDEEQLYLNWITCGLQVVEHAQESYSIDLEIPKSYQVATSFPQHKKGFIAKNFYELVDSPIIASAQLQHHSYKVADYKFHLWILGNCQPDWEKIRKDFKSFTQAQIRSFGGFPTKEYHFMFQILPYKHYHGVEHKHSTVIVLGPSEAFNENSMYQHVLGISSHELYHTWNVTRLRATEMVPYHYERENYSRAGFILEGVTTYYGDLMLRRGNVWNDGQYLEEFNNLLKRHYSNIGRSTYALADSSFDLWLDGYTAQEPRRVSSIYIKGALTAFILDITIRKATKNQFGLDEVMRRMWDNYGKEESGYRIEDYIAEAEAVAGKSLKKYFNELIFGTKPLEESLTKSLKYLGYQFLPINASKDNEALFGFRVNEKNSKLLVQSIVPDSPAYDTLCLEDELLAINEHRVTATNIHSLCHQSNKLSITLFRHNVLKQVTLQASATRYWITYEAKPVKKPTKQQLLNRDLWMTTHL